MRIPSEDKDIRVLQLRDRTENKHSKIPKLAELATLRAQDMPSYYIRCTTDSRLGAIGDAHRIQADLLGAESEVCVELAKLHSLAVDAPKTGMQVVVPQELLPKRRPIWMDKDEVSPDAGRAASTLLGNARHQFSVCGSSYRGLTNLVFLQPPVLLETVPAAALSPPYALDLSQH